jgi:nitric oxide reductase FlRd-NAD(+) reductase
MRWSPPPVCAETALARHAGLMIRRGVVVNSRLQTSDPAIYALGDCAEINGSVLPFLQPILLSAMCLAKNLLSQANELTLPPMLVKVKRRICRCIWPVRHSGTI